MMIKILYNFNFGRFLLKLGCFQNVMYHIEKVTYLLIHKVHLNDEEYVSLYCGKNFWLKSARKKIKISVDVSV